MANILTNPDSTFFTADGTAPLAGGLLFFYASGTSTKLNTYSDPDLAPAHANSNPVVLDSAGRLPNAVFLQNLKYKVVLSPSTDTDPPSSPIWTRDPVYTSDVSARGILNSGSGSPNGVVAGTAGSATTGADEYWDYTNNILYVCTTTGTASTAVWTAINAATAAAVVPSPQGRLTLTSGTPILASDVTAATTVYYTPYTGLLVPIYNGSSFVPISIVSELQATLVSSHTASNIYDFYVFLLNGVPTLGTGPSWSAGSGGSITAGSCARGTGASGAALSRVQGILTNTVSMTMRYGNGTTTTTVAANQGTYVGSMFVDGTNGQVSCYLSWGQSRKYGIWNAFNRSNIILQAGDSTASWVYNTATVRQSNAAAGNTIAAFTGLAEEIVSADFNQNISGPNGIRCGIGLNSTTAYSGKQGWGGTNGATVEANAVSFYSLAPSLGLNNINMNENGAGSGTNTFEGTNLFMVMTLKYRG